MLSYASLSATLLFGVSVVISSVITNVNSSTMIDDATNKSARRAKSVIGTPKILAVTRIHKGSSTQMAKVDSVLDFLKNSVCFASKVLICVSIEAKRSLRYLQLLLLSMISDGCI